MPMYEYICTDCKKTDEHLQAYDDPNPPCVKCGSKETERIISRTSFMLKGDGWFKDGYGLRKPQAPVKEAG